MTAHQDDPTPDVYDGLDEGEAFGLALLLAAGGTLGVPDDYDDTPTPDPDAARRPEPDPSQGKGWPRLPPTRRPRSVTGCSMRSTTRAHGGGR